MKGDDGYGWGLALCRLEYALNIVVYSVYPEYFRLENLPGSTVYMKFIKINGEIHT